MGNQVNNALWPHTPYKIFIGGLDASGKTTILYKLKLNQTVCSVPTIGFNVESWEFKGTKLEFWDVGGGCKIRPLFKHYMPGVVGLIYVFDMYDEQRRDHALQDLWKHHLMHLDVKIPILILANKMDMAKQKADLAKLEESVSQAGPGRRFHIQPCCALSGDGLETGIQWLIAQMKPNETKLMIILT